MPSEATFNNEELGQIETMVDQARDALRDRIVATFGERGNEALMIALALLTGSAFAPDVEQQYDMASTLNQVLTRWKHPIRWRMTSPTG